MSDASGAYKLARNEPRTNEDGDAGAHAEEEGEEESIAPVEHPREGELERERRRARAEADARERELEAGTMPAKRIRLGVESRMEEASAESTQGALSTSGTLRRVRGANGGELACGAAALESTEAVEPVAADVACMISSGVCGEVPCGAGTRVMDVGRPATRGWDCDTTSPEFLTPHHTANTAERKRERDGHTGRPSGTRGARKQAAVAVGLLPVLTCPRQ